jgi:SAM-dependent methyltransferase
MTEYWESRFSKEGAMWKFEPADSAIKTVDIFKKEKINNILIPGFGYGRNAALFIRNGFIVTGIEISRSAIELTARNGIECAVHHGSVTHMPYDNEMYDGIFCYALVHLLNKPERRTFLQSCFRQLRPGGLMIFTAASKQTGLYGTGEKISKDRYELTKGLRCYFYDSEAIFKEFSDFGIIECTDIEEPVKFMDAQEPVKLKFVICKKIK